MAAKKQTAPRLIKRYAGNRLYDPETRTYLTANDLKRMKIEGLQVTVRDAETGQYVTDEVISADVLHRRVLTFPP